MTRATILFASPDRPGLVAKLSGFFAEMGLNILEAGNYTDLHGERGALVARRDEFLSEMVVRQYAGFAQVLMGVLFV